MVCVWGVWMKCGCCVDSMDWRGAAALRREGGVEATSSGVGETLQCKGAEWGLG